jgi:hypothetical protein
MPKSKALKQQGVRVNFLQEENPDNEVMAGIMHGIIEGSNQQQQIAIELTKLVVQKSSEQMNETDIFSTFKRATQVVSEQTPLKEFWEQFS